MPAGQAELPRARLPAEAPDVEFLSFDGATRHVTLFRWIESGTLAADWGIRLDRLTGESGRARDRSAAELSQISLTGSTDRIPALPDFLALIGGRVPLVVEIKSAFDGDLRLARRTAEIVSASEYPIAIKSFDPDVIAHLSENRAALGLANTPLGIVAEADYTHGEWAALPREKQVELANFLHFERSRPDFLSWSVRDLPHPTPYLCRAGLGLPVMSWTVRTPEQRAMAARWADQMVFEGFVP